MLLLLLDNTNGASANPSDEFEKQPRFWGDARQVAQYLLLSTDSSDFSLCTAGNVVSWLLTRVPAMALSEHNTVEIDI